MAVFWICRRWGRALLVGPMGRFVPLAGLGRLEVWFGRYGAPAIAISRFFPGIRALVMPAAGLAGFAAWKVWVFAGVSVIAWNVLVVGVGVFAGSHLEGAKQLLVHYNLVAGVVVGAAVVTILGRFLWRRHRPSPPSASLL
jgi:membrane protein DedA with SNARE-associated domain